MGAVWFVLELSLQMAFWSFVGALSGVLFGVAIRAMPTGRACYCLWRFTLFYDREMNSPFPGEHMTLGRGEEAEEKAP